MTSRWARLSRRGAPVRLRSEGLRRMRRAKRSAAAARARLAGTGFVRPQFFGGMLLTEDDLQAID